MKTLVNFIKQSTLRAKGGKGGGTIERKQVQAKKKSTQIEKGLTKGQKNKLCSKAPITCKKHMREGKGRKNPHLQQ
jgi:hypothetical protein